MATQTNELTIWNDMVPVVTIGNSEFSIWDNGVPVIDVDESSAPTPPMVTARRRATIF